MVTPFGNPCWLFPIGYSWHVPYMTILLLSISYTFCCGTSRSCPLASRHARLKPFTFGLAIWPNHNQTNMRDPHLGPSSGQSRFLSFYFIFVKFGILVWTRSGHDILHPFVNCRFHIFFEIVLGVCCKYDMY